ncbi:MAG: ABC transporter permease [Clostridiales bacterium]|jgi:peptide/nickel transport system permease protein|nr:ABC transporter permease [Eubacteriales bacterium]MDH7566190.1 ABC transporter permease [Clostridiales bacterium]
MKRMKKFIKDKNTRRIFLWGSILTVIILMSVFANLLSAHNPTEVDLKNVFSPPGPENLLGTDGMGRDVFSRILYGGRISLSVSVLSVAISTSVGIAFGGVSGYLGGWLDSAMMRILDAFLAVPTLIVMLALQAIVKGGVFSMILIIGLTGWMSTARIVRSQFAELKQKEFVKAARVLGMPGWKIIMTHLLRNSLSGIFVIAVFNCANAVFTEVSLSFLGMGIPPHIPSWGNMLNNAQNAILTGAWWVGVFPGLMIVMSLLSINFLGEALKRKYGIQGG